MQTAIPLLILEAWPEDFHGVVLPFIVEISDISGQLDPFVLPFLEHSCLDSNLRRTLMTTEMTDGRSVEIMAYL